LTIKYSTSFAVDSNSRIDLTKITQHTIFKAQDVDNSLVQLGEVLFSSDISIKAHDVVIQNQLVDPSVTDSLHNDKNSRMVILSD